MSAITPSTNLKLLKHPINLSKEHQITFTNENSQYTYFNSLSKLEVDNFTYQRINYTIRYKACIDDILDYNYCMYQNEAYSNKWFYAYITNMRYINDNTTEISIETDVYQSFMFDITYKASFVEREHVNNDTIGAHTIPEGLETGDYVCNNIMSVYSGANSCYICIAVSDLTAEVANDVNTDIRQFGGIYSGVNYLVCDSPLAASKTIKAWDAAGKGDAITAVFMIPTSLTGTLTFKTYTTSGVTYNLALPPYTASYSILHTTGNIGVPASLNGYTPKNNKLFCYPYNYFYITNNVGTDVEYHYEDFINNVAVFRTIGSITPGCSIKCYPLNYKKLSDTTNSMNSYNYGISGAKYPICSWATDVYTNWLTQNGVNIAGIELNATQKGYLGGGLMAGFGIAQALSGNPYAIGTIAEGAGMIANTMQQTYQHSLLPDASRGNINSGDITYSAGNMDIPLYKMSVRYEMAECIDNYFTMYGYKVNTVKIPNTSGRAYWNYVKCIGANIEGLIPEIYLNELKKMFNNGITLWHDASVFLDYSQTNFII